MQIEWRVELCVSVCVVVCVCVVADRLNIYQTYSSVSSSRHWCSPCAHLGRAASNGSRTDCHASCDTDRTPQWSRAPSQWSAKEVYINDMSGEELDCSNWPPCWHNCSSWQCRERCSSAAWWGRAHPRWWPATAANWAGCRPRNWVRLLWNITHQTSAISVPISIAFTTHIVPRQDPAQRLWCPLCWSLPRWVRTCGVRCCLWWNPPGSPGCNRLSPHNGRSTV